MRRARCSSPIGSTNESLAATEPAAGLAPAAANFPRRVIRHEPRTFMLTHKSLLEAYVHAKDTTCAPLIHDIYEANAVLSISTSASAVAFPPLVVGAEGIAQTLVTDFAKRFTLCRTYYICDELEVRNGRIEQLPWLVLMREEETASLRIGRG